ncbi:integral membrane protein, partial [Aureobasidium melanogenum]
MTDDRSGQILGVAIAFLIPTAISTALRVYTRTKVLRSQAGRDDVAMVLAFALYLIYLVCQLSGVAHGSGKKRYLIDDHIAQKGLMYWFFCEISYTLATATLKISIGLFLLRIAVDRTHIWIIRWIMIFNVLFGVPYCLLVTFQCKPVSFWWDLDPNHHGKCISPKVIVINTYIISVLNSVADWTFGILPFFIVRKLQMKRQTKIMVASILGFAALGSTATIVRTPFVHTLADFKGEFLYNNADVAIWTTVELGIGCTAANAATLRPLLSRFRAHFGVPSTQTGSRHLGGTISRGGGKRSKRSDLDDQTLVTLDELRAGGQDGGKTEVVIAGGYARDLPPMPSPGLADLQQPIFTRPSSTMNEEQLLRIHRDPLDPWEPAHAAARIINTQISLYPQTHNPALAATQLNALTPFTRQLKPDEQAENIESFLWEFREVVVKLSQAYDEFGIGDKAQTCIVEILKELKKIEVKEVVIWGRPSRLWGNLPIFGPVLTEFYATVINPATMGTHLEPGTFKFITPAQHEPITTHRKKKSQSRRGDDLPAKIVSPADPPRGTSRPILNAPTELLVKIIGYGSQRDKLAWMLACQMFVDPAVRALWCICGRKGVFKLLGMEGEKREHFVATISSLQAIGAISSLTLLSLSFVYFDLPNELEQLKQLASLRTFDLWLERQGADGPLPKNYLTDIVELLSHLPLEEFYSILDFHTAELGSLSKACPRLRVLRFHSWHDLDALNTGSPPLFPKLEHLVTSNFSLDHPVYSKKCIKTWANKLAVAAPVLAHFTRFGVSIWFNTRGGIRRWLASFYDWEERKST